MRWPAPVPLSPRHGCCGLPQTKVALSWSKGVGAAVYGINFGKNRFDVVGCDATGKLIQRSKLTRWTLPTFFAAAPEALIGMKACSGAQWLARKLIAMGHDVSIMPAQFLKPFVKSNKNDARDTEAFTRRPTKRLLQVKAVEHIDMQALHQIHDRIVRQ